MKALEKANNFYDCSLLRKIKIAYATGQKLEFLHKFCKNHNF